MPYDLPLQSLSRLCPPPGNTNTKALTPGPLAEQPSLLKTVQTTPGCARSACSFDQSYPHMPYVCMLGSHDMPPHTPATLQHAHGEHHLHQPRCPHGVCPQQAADVPTAVTACQILQQAESQTQIQYADPTEQSNLPSSGRSGSGCRPLPPAPRCGWHQ